MRVSYLDDDYIGFLQTGYDYWSGAAHGLQYQDFLLFDRQTGEEISVHDLLATSEEEFHNLVAERFEREYPGPDSELDLDYIRGMDFTLVTAIWMKPDWSIISTNMRWLRMRQECRVYEFLMRSWNGRFR